MPERKKIIVLEEDDGVIPTEIVVPDGDGDERKKITPQEGDQKPKPKKWDAVLVAMASIAGIGSLGAAVWSVRPQDPILDVKDITLSGFNLHTSSESMLLAVIDVDLTLYVKIRNPNIAPITFRTTIMDIYYKGGLIGQAKIVEIQAISII